MTLASGTYFELDSAWNDPGWTRVPNTVARCTTISRRLKGWILECASHAPGRRLTFADMLDSSIDGRDATYATIKEGVAAGFITRRQERDNTGRLGVVVYRLHVTPQNRRSTPLPASPDTEEPDTEEPFTVQPDTVNPETCKETKRSLEDQRSLENKRSKPSRASRSADELSPPSQTSLLDDDQDSQRLPGSNKQDQGRHGGDQLPQINGGHVAKAWVDAFVANSNGAQPPTSRIKQVGKLGKELLTGNDPQRVLAAASAAGAKGHAAIDREMTVSRNGYHGSTPPRVSATGRSHAEVDAAFESLMPEGSRRHELPGAFR